MASNSFVARTPLLGPSRLLPDGSVSPMSLNDRDVSSVDSTTTNRAKQDDTVCDLDNTVDPRCAREISLCKTRGCRRE